MIQLVHGTDNYLSYKYLDTLKTKYKDQGYEIKIVNVDDTFEVSDPTIIYGLLSEQDLFGSPKLIILKRITSADLFFKLGKALKTSQKLFDSVKSSINEIILWEDKKLNLDNPLTKLAKEKTSFDAPQKEYEVAGYVQKNFPDINISIKKILLQDIKTTNTNEIASEIEKLRFMPEELLNVENIVLTKNTPAWIISDAVISYVLDPSDKALQGVLKSLNDFNEDLRYKLAIIQNQISDCIYAKRSRKDSKIKDAFFSGKKAFLYTKLSRISDKFSLNFLIDLFQKSLIVEYYLNKGLIDERIALETIFIGDITVMSLELLD